MSISRPESIKFAANETNDQKPYRKLRDTCYSNRKAEDIRFMETNTTPYLPSDCYLGDAQEMTSPSLDRLCKVQKKIFLYSSAVGQLMSVLNFNLLLDICRYPSSWPSPAACWYPPVCQLSKVFLPPCWLLSSHRILHNRFTILLAILLTIFPAIIFTIS